MTRSRDIRDEVGAYLLGALVRCRARAPSRGTSWTARDCRNEVERLRPAADLLPRSVEQVEPPPSLKRSLMEVVEREARGGRRGRAAPRAPAPGERLRGCWRPAAPGDGGGRAASGLLAGFGIAQLGGDDGGRGVVAASNTASSPTPAARLTVQGDGTREAILEVRGMPSPRAARSTRRGCSETG